MGSSNYAQSLPFPFYLGVIATIVIIAILLGYYFVRQQDMLERPQKEYANWKVHRALGLIILFLFLSGSSALIVTNISNNTSTRSNANNALPTPTPFLQNSVTISNFEFTPEIVTVPVGTTVTWTNQAANTAHTVTSDTNLFDSGQIISGNSYMYTFTSPGIYQYHCTNHPMMKGKAIVISR